MPVQPEIPLFPDPQEPLVPPRELQPFMPPTSPLLHTKRTSGGVYNEHTANNSPGRDFLNTESSKSMIVADVPFEHRSSAALHFLGYSYAEGNKLKRVLPQAHPYWEFLRCRQIEGYGIKWRGYAPKAPTDLGAAFLRPPFAEYDLYRMVMHYEPLPFILKTDDQVTEEYQRFVYHRLEPSMENLFIEGGSATGSFAFDNDSDVNNAGKQAFAGGKNIIMPQARVLMTWFDVPSQFIEDSGEQYANILAGIGTVNDDDFMGYPAYTLLADVPRIDTRPNPLPPVISTTPSFLLNITFVFNYFEPSPLGFKANGSTPVDQFGHNMALSRANGRWYPVSRNGDATNRVYQEYDFRKFFRKPVA